jgi:RNA methyltransferase, TrmH family
MRSALWSRSLPARWRSSFNRYQVGIGRGPRCAGPLRTFNVASPYDGWMDSSITSFSNPLVKRFKRLHRTRGRRDAQQTIIEGPTVFGLAMDAGIEPVAMVAVEEDLVTAQIASRLGLPITLVSGEVLRAAADSMQPQSPVAMIDIPGNVSIRKRDTLVLFDISDPGNVGTMIRSAAAFGWDVCVTGATADPWSPKVLRSGVGTHFGRHISFSDDPVVDAHTAGLEVVAGVVAGGSEPVRGDPSIALMIGSEAHGLSEEDTERADRAVTLPMPGEVESLNAAVAASILMFTLTRS